MHSSWPWPVAPCPRGARAAPTGNPRSRRRARPCSPPDETCRSERWPADLRRPCAGHRPPRGGRGAAGRGDPSAGGRDRAARRQGAERGPGRTPAPPPPPRPPPPAPTGGGTSVPISGGLPTGSPDDAFARVVATAHAWGARTLVDAYGPGLAAALAEHPWLVKVNTTEAAEAVGADAPGEPRAGGRDMAQGPGGGGGGR